MHKRVEGAVYNVTTEPTPKCVDILVQSDHPVLTL